MRKRHAITLAVVLLLTLLSGLLPTAAAYADDLIPPPPVEPPPPPEPDDEDLRPLPPEYDGGGRRCNTPLVPEPAASETVPVWAAPPVTTCPARGMVLVPIIIPTDVTARNIFIWRLSVTFDPAVLEPVWMVEDETLSDDDGWVLNRQTKPGELWAGAAGLPTLQGSGTLIYLVFKATGNPGDETDLTFREVILNSGTPPATPYSGRIRLTTMYTIYLPTIAR